MVHQSVYQISPTKKHPDGVFDAAKGKFHLKGNSIPDNAYELYVPLLDWLDQYALNPAPSTEMTFSLVYFNSSSTEYIVSIIKKLEGIHHKKGGVTIIWEYEKDDDDMKQMGDDLANLVSMDFVVKPI